MLVPFIKGGGKREKIVPKKGRKRGRRRWRKRRRRRKEGGRGRLML